MLPENIKLLKALGEESRYLIVEVLLKGEKCACEIPALIGRTQSNTSMHLKKLKEWDLIQSRREGKKIIYFIKERRVYSLFKVLKISENKSLIKSKNKKKQH